MSVAEAAAQAQDEIGRLVQLLRGDLPAGSSPNLQMLDELVRHAATAGQTVTCQAQRRVRAASGGVGDGLPGRPGGTHQCAQTCTRCSGYGDRRSADHPRRHLRAEPGGGRAAVCAGAFWRQVRPGRDAGARHRMRREPDGRPDSSRRMAGTSAAASLGWRPDAAVKARSPGALPSSASARVIPAHSTTGHLRAVSPRGIGLLLPAGRRPDGRPSGQVWQASNLAARATDRSLLLGSGSGLRSAASPRPSARRSRPSLGWSWPKAQRARQQPLETSSAGPGTLRNRDLVEFRFQKTSGNPEVAGRNSGRRRKKIRRYRRRPGS